MECQTIEAQATEKKNAIDEQIAAHLDTLQEMKGWWLVHVTVT